MSKKLLYLSFVAVFGAMSFDTLQRSNGAPVSSTGGPGETTCAQSGCHDDREIASGNAELQININTASFNPGETYSMTVSMSEEAIERFGFQIVALADDDKNAGDFIVTDEERTQSLFNHLEHTDREYITYTYPGTSAIETGYNEWTFDWVAPENVDRVTFYVAGVSANNDGTDLGDVVYFDTMELSATPNNVTTLDKKFSFSSDISENLVIVHDEIIRVQLFSLNGQLLIDYKSETNTGNTQISTNALSNGIYLLTINDQSFKVLKH